MKGLIAAGLLGLGFMISAQSSVDAFSNSYVQESKQAYGEAIKTLQNTGEDSSSVNLRLGWLYYSSGEYVKSKAHYQKAMDQEKSSIEAILGMAYPISAMGNWNEVVRLYENGLKIDAKNSTLKYRLAYVKHYYQKDYSSALGYIQEVQQVQPFDFDTNYLLGAIHLALGNIEQARLAALECLKYNPSSTSAKALYDSVK